MMMTILAAAAAAAAASTATPATVAPAAPPNLTVDTVEITARAPVIGDMQKGTLDFRPEFFTPVRPASAMDMIKWLPGFSFEDTRDMRGLGGAIGNVLIDGQPPTSKTDTLQTVLSRIPSSQVERVDLIVGGAPGIDMRGRPVIANVILKKSAAPRGIVQVSAYTDRDWRVGPQLLITRSQNTDGKLLEGSLTLNHDLYGSPGVGHGPWVRTDGAGNILFAADSRGVAKGPNGTLTGAQERPFLGGRLKLNGSLRFFDYHFIETDTLSTSPDVYSQTADQKSRGLELGVRYERPLGKRTTLETQLLERLNHDVVVTDVERPPAPAVTDARARLEERVGRATIRFKKDETLTLESAGEAAFNRLDSKTFETVAGVPAPLPGAVVEVRESRGEVGETLTWKPNARYSLIAAVKAETSHLAASRGVSLTRDLSYVKPRAVFAYSPDKDTQVRFRLEREVGQVNFYNFVAVPEFNSNTIRLGNANLKAQQAWVAEAVLEKRFWNGASLILTARQSAIRGAVDVAPIYTAGTVLGAADNIGDGRQTDFIASLTLPLKRFGLNGAMFKAGATRTRSRVTDPTTGESRRLSNQAQYMLDAHFTDDLPQWKLTWGIDAFSNGKRVLYRPTTVEDPGPLSRFNLFVEHRPTPNLTLRVEADNVFGFTQPQHILVYNGARGNAPLSYRDDKNIGVSRFFYVRVRQAFQ